MPYTADNLPDDVMKMPANMRERFMSTFNSVYAECEKNGGEECEGKAMAVARAAMEKDAAKAGRMLSESTRATIQAAMDALMKLMGMADEKEQARMKRMMDEMEMMMNGEEMEKEPDKMEAMKSDPEILFDLEAPCKHKAVKSIDESTRRIGGYATVWGELDCEGERMSRKAVEPYITGAFTPVMLWKHGFDKKFFKNAPVGTWDITAFKSDDLGLYVEGNLNFDKYGDEAWKRIKAQGGYGFSVATIWYLVGAKKLPDGSTEITDWPPLDISVMEGGKQCVPSAYRTVKSDLGSLFAPLAAKMGKTLPLGVYEMDENELQQQVATAVATALAARDKVTADEQSRKNEIAAKAKEMAETQIAAEKTKLEAEYAAKLEAERAKNPVTQARKSQPTAPPQGTPGATPELSIVSTPYDRMSTMDLCVKYELLKSWGKEPSGRFRRALVDRAAKMATEEDVLYYKAGQAVKAPALAWEDLIPKNLELSESDEGSLFAAKAGGRFGMVGDTSSDIVTPRGLSQLRFIATQAAKANELVYSTQANAGDEWVPTLMNAQLWRTIRLESAVLNQFTQFDMPSQPYDYPIESTDPVFYKVGESTDESQLVLTGGPFTDSKPGTGKITFSAGKLGAISYWTEEMEEDAIIATEPQFRDQYGTKFAHVLDEVALSGDETTGTTNISLYGGSIGATSRFLILDGLRHEPLVTTTTDARSGGTLTIDDFGATRALMGTAGKFGVNPRDLVIISDPGVYHKAVMLPEVLTLDKFGAAATVYNGQLASILGVPYIVSEDYALTDSSGYINNTGGSNTLGSFLIINKRGVMVGWRRRPRIRVVGLPGAEAKYIVGSARLDIRYKEAGMVAASYNLTV